MDKKKRWPAHMLSIRGSLQNKRSTQTKSEGLEKNIQAKGQEKNLG